MPTDLLVPADQLNPVDLSAQQDQRPQYHLSVPGRLTIQEHLAVQFLQLGQKNLCLRFDPVDLYHLFGLTVQLYQMNLAGP